MTIVGGTIQGPMSEWTVREYMDYDKYAADIKALHTKWVWRLDAALPRGRSDLYAEQQIMRTVTFDDLGELLRAISTQQAILGALEDHRCLDVRGFAASAGAAGATEPLMMVTRSEAQLLFDSPLAVSDSWDAPTKAAAKAALERLRSFARDPLPEVPRGA